MCRRKEQYNGDTEQILLGLCYFKKALKSLKCDVLIKTNSVTF